MEHRHRSVVAVALLTWGLAVGCASSDSPRETATASRKANKKAGKQKVGAPMPSIIVKQLNDKRKIDLGALRGKVVLVDIWASWCAPCMEELPLLDEMAMRLKEKGIDVIAVSVDEDKENAQAFLGTRHTWTLTVAHDPTGKVPDTLQPSKMPTSYVVDKEGIIRYVNEGFERADMKKLETRLTVLAAEAS